MDRGLVGTARGFPVKGQHQAHEANGTPVVYEDAEDAVNSLRVIDGVPDRLVIAGPLHILAPSRNDIRELVERVKAAGCDVFDIINNQSTEGTGWGAAWLTYDLTNPAHHFKDASAAGKKGAEARHKKHKPKGVSVADAKRIWKDLNISTNREALSRMGWSLGRAWKKFGGSGRVPGARKK